MKKSELKQFPKYTTTYDAEAKKGDVFVVMGDSVRHGFAIGSKVELADHFGNYSVMRFKQGGRIKFVSWSDLGRGVAVKAKKGRQK